jgi:ATP-dependent DNA helicase RecG
VVTFRPAPGFAAESAPQVAPEVTPEVTPEVAKLLLACRTPKSRKKLQDNLGLRDAEHFRRAYLLPALESGLLERTIPDKPQSTKQQYRLTARGREWLEQQGRP